MTALRKVFEDIDPSTQELQAQKEALKNLTLLAESKAEYFELRVATNLRTAGSEENQTIPVEAVLNTVTQTHAFSSKDAGVIGDVVTKALKSFCSDAKADILTGVGSLISDALTTFLGSGSAEERTLKQYYVLTEGLSVVRVDVMAWSLGATSTGITKRVEKASAFVAVKSSVDLARVKFNTFLNLYQRQLKAMKLEEKALQDAIREAKDIYKEFTSNVERFALPVQDSPEILALTSLPG